MKEVDHKIKESKKGALYTIYTIYYTICLRVSNTPASMGFEKSFNY